MDAEHISAFGTWAAAICSLVALIPYLAERGERRASQKELKELRVEEVEAEVRRVNVSDNRVNFLPYVLADKTNYQTTVVNRSNDSIFKLILFFIAENYTVMMPTESELNVGDSFDREVLADQGGSLGKTWLSFEDIKGKHWWRSSTGEVFDETPIELTSMLQETDRNIGIKYSKSSTGERSGLYTDGLIPDDE